MSDLVLAVKRCYFDQIKAGVKLYEYRLYNAFWRKRLEGKTFDRVIITLGYPRKDDDSRRITFPWNGYDIIQRTHEHFGADEVKVFAIKLLKGTNERWIPAEPEETASAYWKHKQERITP